MFFADNIIYVFSVVLATKLGTISTGRIGRPKNLNMISSRDKDCSLLQSDHAGSGTYAISYPFLALKWPAREAILVAISCPKSEGVDPYIYSPFDTITRAVVKAQG